MQDRPLIPSPSLVRFFFFFPFDLRHWNNKKKKFISPRNIYIYCILCYLSNVLKRSNKGAIATIELVQSVKWCCYIYDLYIYIQTRPCRRKYGIGLCCVLFNIKNPEMNQSAKDNCHQLISFLHKIKHSRERGKKTRLSGPDDNNVDLPFAYLLKNKNKNEFFFFLFFSVFLRLERSCTTFQITVDYTSKQTHVDFILALSLVSFFLYIKQIRLCMY